MKHPSRIWTDPEFAHESLLRLCSEYVEYLSGRAQRASPGTIEKYNKTLLSFIRSLDRQNEPPVLGSLTPATVQHWIAEQRQAGRVEEGIASRLSALKVFAHKYVYRYLELTTDDLLRKVPRIVVPEKPVPALTEDECEKILACFDGESYEQVRNRAILSVFLATGLRLREVLNMSHAGLDTISGEFSVTAKGNHERPVRLSPRALKCVKAYLRVRPKKSPSDHLWLRDNGETLGYAGVQMIFRRLKVTSGLPDVHAHLLRHTFAQIALSKGAERAAVQDMLGHRTDAMSRRYAGTIRQETAAKMMPKYAPI